MTSDEKKREIMEIALQSHYSYEDVLSLIESIGGGENDVLIYGSLLHNFKCAVKEKIPDYFTLLFEYMQKKGHINNRRARKIRIASKEPLDRMPLLINDDDPYISGMAKWRLKKGY